MGDSPVRAARRRIYGARMTSPKPARLAATALLALLAACGDTAEPQAATTTPPATTTAAAIRDPAMCAAVGAAVTTWDATAPQSAAEVEALSPAQMAATIQASDALLAGVEGYDDPNTKILGLAVAEYGFVLANANLILTNTGELDDGRAEQVAGKAAAIRSTHDNLQGISCSGA